MRGRAAREGHAARARAIRLRGTLSQEALDDVRAIQRFLGHDEDGGDMMKVIERALKLMRRECDKKRAAGRAPAQVPLEGRHALRAGPCETRRP